jgi:hypothetical protein
MANMKIKLIYGTTEIDGKSYGPGEPFALDSKEAQSLIDRGLATDAKDDGAEAEGPLPLGTAPKEKVPPEVLKNKEGHQGIEEVTDAKQLPNRSSQK